LGGPWGEPSLARLIQVAHTPGDFWPEKILHQAAASPGGHRWPQLALALEEIMAQVGRLPLAGLVHQFLAETGAWSDLAAWEGAAGVANARTYLELLAQAETGVPESTYRKVDLALQEAYQPPDPQAQASRVEMLTVHGVKGLEYHQVFLPFVDWQPLLGGGKQNPPFILEEISASRQHGLALAPPFWQEQPSLLYRSLKNLRDKKLLAEARRLFYVAVTRAKEKLFLSAVVKLRNQGQWQLPEKSPLAWLWEHYRGPEEFQGSALWADPELRVEVWEEYAAPAPESRPVQEPPPAWEFEPERAPYELRFPSQLAGTPAEIGDWGVTGPQNGGPLPSLSATQPVGDAAPIGAPPSPDALTLMDFHRHLPRLRGELTHRLLETLAQGEALPDIAAVAAALRGYAVDQELAAGLAAEILTEVQACAADPVLAPLLSPAAPTALSEWRLEDQPAPGIIRRGQLDRLVFHGHQWWLLDYKTSRPGPQDDWENFMAWEAAAYRPQLLAYRDLAAKAKGLAPAKINLALYFTGCRKMLILG
jgi:ATP-dependent exoDNAse (exonuclease V) beta subunit